MTGPPEGVPVASVAILPGSGVAGTLPLDVADELAVAGFLLRAELEPARRAVANFIAGREVGAVVEARAELVRAAWAHYRAVLRACA